MRKYQKIPFTEVAAALELLKVREHELSSRLGYSDNAVTEWKKAGEAPAVVGLAIQALLHHASLPPTTTQTSTLICVVVSGLEKTTTIENLLKMAGGRFWSIQLDNGHGKVKQND